MKNREILRIRCRSGSGGAAKLKNVKITCSKCCKESTFQFSAKSDNIYYAYLQSGQNHTLIPPPLGAEVGTENPINGAMATFIDRSG